ncbi:MAG: SH3 domain-containing protein [Endomicrobiales bacterium]
MQPGQVRPGRGLPMGGLAAFLFTRQRWLLFSGIPAAALLLFLSGGLLLKVHYETQARRAVVISGPLEVRNGPGIENSVGFTLPEGRKVTVLSEKDGWAAGGSPPKGLKDGAKKTASRSSNALFPFI